MFNKLLWLAGLSVLFTACSTNNYLAANSKAWQDNSARNVGVRYLLGRGVEQDDKKAFYYFKKGAEEGDVLAQNELAYLYAAGKGTAKNTVQAFKWYQRAANRGIASAQYNLGLMYFHGIGTDKDKEKGMEWFKKSAEHDFEPAKMALGLA